MVANVVAKKVVTIPHKPMKMAILGRTSMVKCYSREKYRHFAIKCQKKKCDGEANLTFTQDQESALMLIEKMLNEEKVMANLFTKGEDLSGDQHVVP